MFLRSRSSLRRNQFKNFLFDICSKIPSAFAYDLFYLLITLRISHLSERLEDDNLMTLTWLLISTLAFASKNRKRTISVNPKYAATRTGVSPNLSHDWVQFRCAANQSIINEPTISLLSTCALHSQTRNFRRSRWL